jgi:hypothetical protein
MAVAEDPQDDLESPSRGTYVGAGTAMQSGIFFSGLNKTEVVVAW